MNGDGQFFGENGSGSDKINENISEFSPSRLDITPSLDEPALLGSYDSSAARSRFNILGFAFAIFTVMSFVASQLQVLLAAAIESLTGAPITSSNLFLNAVTPIALYLFALPILILFLKAFKVEGSAPKGNKLSLGAWIMLFVISFGLLYIGSYMGQFTMWGLSGIVGYDYSNMLNEVIDYDSMWVTVIFLCIVAPIGEEFVFRKLLIDRTHKYGGTVSIFLSALMFGLMHANFYQFFYAFLLGLLLGYVYYSTGKVWYTIALHAGLNFVGSVLTSYLQLGIENMEKAQDMIADPNNAAEMMEFAGEYAPVILAVNAFMIFVFVSMLCAIILPIVLRKKITLERGGVAIPVGKTFGAAFKNIGVPVLLIVYALQFLQNIILPPLAEYLKNGVK